MDWLVIGIGIVFLIGIISGICKGAIKITVSLATTIVTLALVFFATPMVTKLITDFTPMDEVIEDKVSSAITSVAMAQLSGGEGNESLDEGTGLTAESVERVLQAAGVSASTLEQYNITVQDIVDGNVSSEELAKYGISSSVLDGLKQTESSGSTIDDLINNAEIPKDMQISAIENAELPDVFKELLQENNNSEVYEELGVDTFAQYVGAYLAKLIIHIISFLITFIIVTLILRAIIFALDFIADLPGVGILNRLAGGVIGIAGAAVVVWILFIVITLLYTTEIGKGMYDTIQAQPYLHVLYEYNPIMKLATIFK